MEIANTDDKDFTDLLLLLLKLCFFSVDFVRSVVIYFFASNLGTQIKLTKSDFKDY